MSTKVNFRWLIRILLAMLALSGTAAALPPIRVPTQIPTWSSKTCPPLLPSTGRIVHVSTVVELQEAVVNLQSNTTILIADGTYDLTQMLNIRPPATGTLENVTLRSASGNRDGVILRGKGMDNSNFGNVPNVIAIYNATNVLLADMTLRDAYYHLVQVHGEDGPQYPLLYNLHLVDSGEQFVKVSTAGPSGLYSDDGMVACSLIEYTTQARSDYTNGVDILAGARWTIRDNIFRNIRYSNGLAGPAVLAWRNSLDTLVERNQFLECARAIALGLSPPDSNSRDGETVYDHQGGIVRNNFIYRLGSGDIGITVNYARNFRIYHNTVLLNGTFPYGAIEYRFPVSTGDIRYNLTDAPIWQRDGASATLTGNLTGAGPGWFVNPAAGDLHLLASASAAIDQATSLDAVRDDFDGDPRPIGPAADIGADEFGTPNPRWITFLPVSVRK